MSHLLTRAAATHAGRTAFVFNDLRLTYGELNARATRLAQGLRSLGISKGAHVAILIANRPEYAEAEFAVAKLGAVRIPFLIQSTADELERWLYAAECRAVIASPEALDRLRAAVGRLDNDIVIVVIDGARGRESDYEALIAANPEEPLDVDITGDDRYAIRFTGGTTGTPKGVVMSHRNMVTVVVNTVLNWPIDRTDIGLHIHPMSHAAGMMMYAYWLVGATNVIRPAFGFDPADFVASVEKYRATSVFIIPTILNLLLDAEVVRDADLSSMRLIVYGGAPIPLARLEEGLKRFGPVFLQVYGTSEAPFALTTLHREDHLPTADGRTERIKSAGREIVNVEVKVVDEQGCAVPIGQVGEVAARGDNTMVGYWKNPELTAQRVRDGWVRTGDMGYLDADGYLYIVDRKDDMIITGGFNVWPTEIEDILCRHPEVREAAVFGVPDDKWGEAVTAVVVLRRPGSVTPDEIIEFMAQHVTKYKVPKRVYIRAGLLPKSPVGKLLRRQVRRELLESGAGTR